MLFKNYFIRGNNNSTDLEKATTNNAHSSNHDALKIIKKLLKLLEQKQETIDEIKKERMARPLKELDPPKKGASDFEVAVYRQQSTIKTFMSKHGMSYDDLSAAIEWPKSKLMPFMHIKSTRVRAGKRELRPAQLFTIEDLIRKHGTIISHFLSVSSKVFVRTP